MRFGSALGFGVLAGMASIPACTPLTFRPASPRRVEGDGVVVEIRRAALRPFVVDVDVAGASPAVDGAWVSRIAAPEGTACARNLAARSIEKVGSTAAGGSFKVHFDQTVLAALDGSSTLELRVAADGDHVRCIAVPLSGTEPSLRWILEPWGSNRPFAGRGIGVWFPVGSHRTSTGTDLMLLRLGRWWGPLRLGGGVGLGFFGFARRDRALVIPTALTAEAFPVVAGHFALGVGASYALRPSWFVNDSSRGFELVHGPVGSIQLAYIPRTLVGFLEGPRAGTIGLAFSVGRWLPDGGATVLAISLSMN